MRENVRANKEEGREKEIFRKVETDGGGGRNVQTETERGDRRNRWERHFNKDRKRKERIRKK